MKKNVLANKNGFISIYMIMWLAVLVPFFIFTFMDVTHYVAESIHLKGVTDNASASAVTQIKEELVKYGTLEIDTVKAEKVARKIIADSLNLNEDLTKKSGTNVLKSEPMVSVQVINIFSDAGLPVETPLGQVKIYKPSVIVYVEYPVRGLFFKTNVTMKKIGISQVQFLDI